MHIELYSILGINHNASPADIKKAYRKQAIKWHPDKNTENQEIAEKKFKDISEAYAILSDPEKKQIYDQHGMDGIRAQSDGGMHGNPSDIFDMFFGNGRNSSQKQSAQQVEEVEISLFDLYHGCTKNIEVECLKRCNGCSGMGSHTIITCKTCHGRGVIEQTIRMGPMIQQMRQMCSQCHGQGKYPSPTDKCKNCKGKGLATYKKNVKFTIERGSSPKDHSVFHYEGSENKNGDPSHLVLVISEAKTKGSLERHGSDLFMRKTIQLSDALSGVEWEFTHLNKESLCITETTVIKDKEKRYIPGYGMPVKGTQSYGNLIIEYNVVYPTHLISKNDISQFIDVTTFQKSAKSTRKQTKAYNNTKKKNNEQQYHQKQQQHQQHQQQCAQQ